MNSENLSGIQKILDSFINGLNSKDVVSHWVEKKHAALLSDIPSDLHPILQNILQKQFPNGLFAHQTQAWHQVKAKKNIVVCTGTSSGKSLCYYLPILNDLIIDDNSTALLLFPTKALTSDQLLKLKDLLNSINSNHFDANPLVVSSYDGDTRTEKRVSIRSKVNILLTNPDMLHLGILPHHTSWENFLKNLKYVVIDEIHLYRGVFGSHFANVIRRLKRILLFYGADPQFILTSATISNPQELSEKLIEEKFVIINSDASAKEEKHFFFINPPIIDESLGLRKGMIDQSIEIANLFYKNDIQFIFFSRTRKTVELVLRKFNDEFGNQTTTHGYRSGYLPKERREIESGLRQGLIKSVISTNALEMGIDMGKVDAIVMMGYPGSISSFFQQAGRAGRRNQESAAILVASASPIDQYIIRHDEYIQGGNPENALLDPDNPLILLNHLRSAAFELPFRDSDHFGELNWEKVLPYLQILCALSDLIHKKSAYYWVAEEYPASDISLRNINKSSIALRYFDGINSVLLGEIDYASSFKTVHPGAAYLHDGDSYLVKTLDIENSSAVLISLDDDYITEPQVENSIKVESVIKSKQNKNFDSYFGELRVIEKVAGFKRIDWKTQQLIGVEELNLPEIELLTKGVWLSLSSSIVNLIRENNQWQSDPNQYGKEWTKIRSSIIARDENRCQVCGLFLEESILHVHHKVPFRSFSDTKLANQFSNLISLCPSCHKRVEQNVRIRSGLTGAAYILANISPLFLMCDYRDIGYFTEPESDLCEKQPVIAIYDQFPGGIGLSAKLFEILDTVLNQCLLVLNDCQCLEGCPSCVGPAGENGIGGKESAKQILTLLLK